MMVLLFRSRHKVLTFMTPKTAGVVDRLNKLEEWTVNDVKK